MARLTYIGHATLLIEMDGVRLLTDPILRGRVGPLYRHGPALDPAWQQGIDAVLISHLHWDHLDLPSLRRLGVDTRVIVPRGAAPVLRRAGFRRVEELAAGVATKAGPLSIRATPANHTGFRPPFGPMADCAGYLVQGEQQIYFAGDTDLFPEMALLANGLDLALLPVGGWGPNLGPGHLDPWRAAVALSMLRPRLAVPIHWGSLAPIGLRWLRPELLTRPPRDFVRYADLLAPRVQVRVLAPGQSLVFDSS